MGAQLGAAGVSATPWHAAHVLAPEMHGAIKRRALVFRS